MKDALQEELRNVGIALRDVGISPNESDINFEPANIVDGLFAIARSISKLGDAIDRAQERFEQSSAPGA